SARHWHETCSCPGQHEAHVVSGTPLMSQTSMPSVLAGTRFPAAGRHLSAHRRIPAVVVSGCTRLGETALLTLTGLAVATLWLGSIEAFEDTRYITAILATAITAVLAGQRLDIYSQAALTAPLRQTPRVALAWTTAMAGLVATLFL